MAKSTSVVKHLKYQGVATNHSLFLLKEGEYDFNRIIVSHVSGRRATAQWSERRGVGTKLRRNPLQSARRRIRRRKM